MTITYKLHKNYHGDLCAIECVEKQISFSIDAIDNIDYQTFKQQINDGTAQLEDADGNLMTEQQAKDYVATLP
jgi:hypothetical protein